jgi:hypothetical protein
VKAAFLGMQSNDPYENLAVALRERLKTIADREAYERDPQEHLERLKRVSALIETCKGSLPGPVEPQLSHYLERASYDKALAYIEETHPSLRKE